MFSSTISLDSILQVKPNTWTISSYSGKNYVTEELCTDSNEYKLIENEIRLEGINGTVSKIERVQHPFAYGRFLIRKEQLEKRSGRIILPTRKFYKVSNEDLQEAVEYNMDNRRAPSITSFGQFSSFPNHCIVVVQRLQESKSRDSEEYPEYIVYLN